MRMTNEDKISYSLKNEKYFNNFLFMNLSFPHLSFRSHSMSLFFFFLSLCKSLQNSSHVSFFSLFHFYFIFGDESFIHKLR